MSAQPRAYTWLFLTGGLVTAMATTCAQATQGEDPVASTGTGASGGGIPGGQIGGPCVEAEDCVVEGSSCTPIGDGYYCTIPCPPACPLGTYCAIVGGSSICVPDFNQQCDLCTSALDCKGPSDACLTSPFGDKFCARDCSTLPDCPAGFTCVPGWTYPPSGSSGTGGSGSSGTGGSGTGGGGTGGGGTGGSDAGTDGGPDDGGIGGGPSDAGTGMDAMPPPGQPYKFCVPNGVTCPCSEKRDGVTRPCETTTPSGTCTGIETCNGDTGQWEGCTAGSPEAEVCNNKDDNCNGMVDEGDPNDLCADQGPPPANSGWLCQLGMCKLGPCDMGWTQYPPGSMGCTCAQELGEPNGTCSAATGAGMVDDTPGSMLTIQGTLSSATDVDVWVFDTVDTDEMITNSYHVSIDFTAPMPNDEFVFDVMRIAPMSMDMCQDMPAGPATGLTSYDWCVDGVGGPMQGEEVCSVDGPIHCNDWSGKYYVRVYRKPGATGTCTEYSITVTGEGGDLCDFSSQCPPP